jgi:hypothetical protein
LQIKTKIVSCHTANSKPVKQEVSGTVILPPLVLPALALLLVLCQCKHGLTRQYQKHLVMGKYDKLLNFMKLCKKSVKL